VTGDGDTASIGIGQFVHAIRRNLDMVYIIENNGVYGLTKGQYSATVEKGSRKKKGEANAQPPIDLCAMAINLGCSFVARSFSGSKKQLTALVRAAMGHRGMAVIDVISPCVTFSNNDESYKSYNYVKANDEVLHLLDYIPHFTPMEEVDIPEGEYEDIQMFDGSTLRLETIGSDHDPSDAMSALKAIHQAERGNSHVTGLLYYEAGLQTADEVLGLTEAPLSGLSEAEMRPSRQSLDDVNAALRVA
jgi:2-oxoglutarate ferredoxin oxidoreductase subunit beta